MTKPPPDAPRRRGTQGAPKARGPWKSMSSRDLPAGALHGLYERVRERAAAGGAGLSEAFLDAPRALRVWRTAALAASALLVVSTGFALHGVLAPDATPRAAERAIEDARPVLLERWERGADPSTVPVLAPPAHRIFFRGPGERAVPVDAEIAPRGPRWH